MISLAKYKNDGLGVTFQYEFMDGLMDSLYGILYLISYLRSIPKKAKIEAVNNKIKNNLIKDNKDNKYNNSNKRKIFFLILIITIFEILGKYDIIPNIFFFFWAIFYPLYLVYFKFIIQYYFLSAFLICYLKVYF